MRSALKLILEPLGLSYRIRHGIVWITTSAKHDEVMFPVVYDVSDLTATTRNGIANLSTTIQNATSGPFHDVEGIGGQINDSVPGVFVIRQYESMHAEIEQLLADMRRTRNRKKTNKKPDAKQVTLDTVETRIHWVANPTAIADLIKTIPRLIDPAGWAKRKEFSVHKVGNTLAVRQTVRNQIRIAAFLSTYGRLDPAPLPERTRGK